MTAYAFGKGEVISDGFKATIYDVSLNFEQKLEHIMSGSKVMAALGDEELKISGTYRKMVNEEGNPPEYVQVVFHTSTPNFGVSKDITIMLNRCKLREGGFAAEPDQHGNVFTLTTKD